MAQRDQAVTVDAQALGKIASSPSRVCWHARWRYQAAIGQVLRPFRAQDLHPCVDRRDRVAQGVAVANSLWVLGVGLDMLATASGALNRHHHRTERRALHPSGDAGALHRGRASHRASPWFWSHRSSAPPSKPARKEHRTPGTPSPLRCSPESGCWRSLALGCTRPYRRSCAPRLPAHRRARRG